MELDEPIEPFQNSVEADKPRLTIRSLVLENFKSYAGRQEIGPFHSCFSAVVGPNGSGKSNVIDAVLFVFGKQAKTLRLNKVSDLIHKSDQYPDLQDCRVTVNFYDTVCNKDGIYQPVEGSELTLTRTATAKNTSKYYMNEKSVTREVVVDLLKKRGVDLENNRFLILQFEVEQIARMKPKAKTENETGLLEYLEDIIGTNQYVEPIEVTFKELEVLNDERTSRLTRLKQVQGEKQGLEEVKNEAETCLELESSVIDKQSIVFQIERLRSEKKSKVCEEKAKEIEDKLIAHREQMLQVSTASKEIEKNYESETKASEKMAKTLNDAKTKYTKYERQDIQISEDKKHITKQIDKLKKTITQTEKTISTKQKLIKENTSEIEEWNSKASNLVEPLKKEEKLLEKMFEGIKDEVAPLHIELENKQKELMPFQKNIDEAQARLDLSQNELNLFTSQSEQAKAKLHQAEVDIKTLGGTIAEKKKSLTEIKKEIVQAEKEVEKAEGELKNLSGADTSLLQTIGKARSKAEEANRLLGQGKSQSKILTALMSLKKKELPGIFGRLGNLGTMENLEKYDVAISTACTRLDNIVVDNMETAQRCIEHLRLHNLGRATFIALDKIQKYQSGANSTIQTPEHSERLFDLIKVHNPEVKVAFYFALTDTLVTDTLERATKIAYGQKRWRVVTLDGKIIDVSGTMSGGGSNPAKGGMTKSVESHNDPEALKIIIEQNNTIAEEKSAELQKLHEKFNSLEHQVEQLTKALDQKKKSVPRIELDINELTKQLKELEARIPVLKEGCHSNDQEEKNIAKIRESVEKDQVSLASAKKKAEKLLGQIQTIQTNIENAGGKKLKDQKVKVENMSKAIEEANETVTKLEVAIAGAKTAITKSEKSIKKDNKSLEQFSKDLEAKETESAELLQVAGEVLEKRDELEKHYNEKLEELKKIRSSYEKVKKEFVAFRSTEVDYTNQLEDANKIVEENAKKATFSAAKLDKLRTKKLALRIDESDDVELPILNETELAQYDPNELIAEITSSKLELSNLKPNLAAIKEWRLKHSEFESRKQELDEVTEQRDSKRKTYEELRKKRLDEFMEGFNIIRRRLAEMYKMITLDDGDADLEPNDNLDPFSEGISFRVRPPKKTWKYIYNLSGGEMTLSSLALVFALHTYKPTPIYIMDEIDAALDFKNVSIVANYIKERTKNAQFIIVSLRNFMFEVADRLVGIYKTQNCTKSITINPASYMIGQPQEQPQQEQQTQQQQPQQQYTQKSQKLRKEKAKESPKEIIIDESENNEDGLIQEEKERRKKVKK